MPIELASRALPVCTPELVAAVANHYIELLAQAGRLRALDQDPNVHEVGGYDLINPAITEVTGSMRPGKGDELADMKWNHLADTAFRLARASMYVRPFELLRTGPGFGTVSQPHKSRHTITYFIDGNGYDHRDLAAIQALEPGESYVLNEDESNAHIISRVE